MAYRPTTSGILATSAGVSPAAVIAFMMVPNRPREAWTVTGPTNLIKASNHGAAGFSFLAFTGRGLMSAGVGKKLGVMAVGFRFFMG